MLLMLEYFGILEYDQVSEQMILHDLIKSYRIQFCQLLRI